MIPIVSCVFVRTRSLIRYNGFQYHFFPFSASNVSISLCHIFCSRISSHKCFFLFGREKNNISIRDIIVWWCGSLQALIANSKNDSFFLTNYTFVQGNSVMINISREIIKAGYIYTVPMRRFYVYLNREYGTVIVCKTLLTKSAWIGRRSVRWNKK